MLYAHDHFRWPHGDMHNVLLLRELFDELLLTMTEQREMTFGEKAVGLTFNPSGDPTVEAIKRKCADLIDEIHELRTNQPNAEIARMASVAITDIQSGQMWAVKAATWRY